MHEKPKNSISFKVYGRYALFTDPVTKIGGEKCTYHLPTYEAIKGVLKSIYCVNEHVKVTHFRG